MLQWTLEAEAVNNKNLPEVHHMDIYLVTSFNGESEKNEVESIDWLKQRIFQGIKQQPTHAIYDK